MCADIDATGSAEPSWSDGAPAPLWAITSYFNPCRYTSRLRNLRRFRRALTVPADSGRVGVSGPVRSDRR